MRIPYLVRGAIAASTLTFLGCSVLTGLDALTDGTPDAATPIDAPTTTGFVIGGTASGPIRNVTLADNGGDPLVVDADGPFAFANKVASGGSYVVTIVSTPPSLACTLTNAVGHATANVIDVLLDCALVGANDGAAGAGGGTGGAGGTGGTGGTGGSGGTGGTGAGGGAGGSGGTGGSGGDDGGSDDGSTDAQDDADAGPVVDCPTCSDPETTCAKSCENTYEQCELGGKSGATCTADFKACGQACYASCTTCVGEQGLNCNQDTCTTH